MLDDFYVQTILLQLPQAHILNNFKPYLSLPIFFFNKNTIASETLLRVLMLKYLTNLKFTKSAYDRQGCAFSNQ